MSNTTGAFYVGRCLGVASKTGYGENAKTSFFVGVQVEQPNGFSEPDLVTKRFKLTNEQVKNGFQHQFDKLKGQAISVPYFEQPWTLDDGRTGSTAYVSNGYVPQALGK